MAPEIVHVIAEGTWRLQSELDGRNVFQYLLASPDRDELLLVDTGTSATPREVIAPALRKLGLSPDAVRVVVVTHPDVDHQGGLAAIKDLCPGAAATCGFYDRPMVGQPEQLLRDRYQPYLEEHGLGYGADEQSWIRAHYGAPVELDATFSGGEAIQLGPRRLEVLHAPGHSAGHLVLFERESGLLFSSDAVHWNGCPGVDGGRAMCPTYEEVDSYLGSIELLERLGPGEVHSGHWPVRRGGEVATWLAESREFAVRVDDVLLEHLDRPTTMAELCDHVQRQLGPWRSEPKMLMFVVHGHLRRLVRAARAQALEGLVRPRRYRRAESADIPADAAGASNALFHASAVERYSAASPEGLGGRPATEQGPDRAVPTRTTST
jgi:glyoxylase-like metal-dependent hydrolase (beta-lactamase superfamily II)